MMDTLMWTLAGLILPWVIEHLVVMAVRSYRAKAQRHRLPTLTEVNLMQAQTWKSWQEPVREMWKHYQDVKNRRDSHE